MMSRSKSASSLLSLESGGGGWSPPPSRDWRAAISTPLAYRLGNSTLHFRPHLILVTSIVVLGVIFLLYSSISGKRRSKSVILDAYEHGHLHEGAVEKYPLSPVLYDGDMKIYKIAVISDLDTDSKVGDNKWKSYFRKGELRIKVDHSKVEVNIAEKGAVELSSNIGAGGRGMELSELSVFNGKLYTVDDRTGIIYQILDNTVIPWVIISNGPGNQEIAK